MATTLKSGTSYITVRQEVKTSAPDNKTITTSTHTEKGLTEAISQESRVAALTAASTAADIVKALQGKD